MRAAIIRQFGAPDVLAIQDVPDPVPGAREVLVRVRASALNRADVLQRLGRYPAPNGAPRDIPGLEFAGEVAGTGAGAARWRIGDRVFGLVAGGAHAQFVVAHEDTLAAIPDRLDWLEAAAIPEAVITAYDALVTQAALRPGERVLIHAVGSGVGLAAVQLVRAWGALPYGTSRTVEKLERAAVLGLEDGVVLAAGLAALGPAVERWAGPDGVDVVLDLVGGPYVGASVEVLSRLGRLMLVGTVAGGQASFDLRRVLARRLTLRGTVMRARALGEKIDAIERFSRDVVPLLSDGRVCPVVDQVFALDDIAGAHRRMESNASFGKIVLRVD